MPRLRDMNKGELFGGKREEKGKAEQIGPTLPELAEEAERLEKEMNELRAQYELYFMGVEKREPRVRRDGLRARIRRLRETKLQNTMLKFKVQMIAARFITLE